MKKKSTDFPKIMRDQSSPSGFTGMTPEDDVKIKEFNRLDRSTYPSDPKQREKLFKEAMTPTMFPKYVGRNAKAKWNAIYKEMTPKERREFFKDKREKPKGLYDDLPKPTPLPSTFKSFFSCGSISGFFKLFLSKKSISFSILTFDVVEIFLLFKKLILLFLVIFINFSKFV